MEESMNEAMPLLVMTRKIRRRRKKAAYTLYGCERKSEAAKLRFNAFEVKKKIGLENGKKVIVRGAVEPETGIHSRAWAQAIKAQPESYLMSLPLELRTRIWSFVLASKQPITPGKKLKKFKTLTSCPSVAQYILLSLLCRQAYIEVTGSALLYKVLDFQFNSDYQFLNYVPAINPLHRENLTSLSVVVSFTKKGFNSNVLMVLNSLKGLKELYITVNIPDVHYDRMNGQVKDKGLELMKDEKNWASLSGLKKFEIHFKYPQKSSHQWSGSVRAERRSRNKQVQDEIRKVVMRKL